MIHLQLILAFAKTCYLVLKMHVQALLIRAATSPQPKLYERFLWEAYKNPIAYGVLLGLLIWLLTSCQGAKKARSKPAPSAIIYADTARVKLVHKADQSQETMLILRQAGKSSHEKFNQAQTRYDSIQIVLP